MIFQAALRRAFRLIPLALPLLLLSGALLWLPHKTPAGAQAQDSGKSSATAQELAEAVDDIDRLRVLNPLKLTGDQLEQLASGLTTIKADYEKKVNAVGANSLSSLAEKIRAVKKKALAGEAIPADYDEQVNKANAEFLKKRDEVNAENILAVSALARKVYTEKQIAAAIKQEKAAYAKRGTDTSKIADDKFFNLYVVDIFISYSHAIPLLKEMRAAASP